MVLTLVGVWFGRTGAGILGRHAPAWAAHMPFILRLCVVALYGGGVILLSVSALRKFTGGTFAALITLNALDALRVDEIAAIIVSLLVFAAVWHFFDWHSKSRVPRESRP
jgi:hypothetical protein